MIERETSGEVPYGVTELPRELAGDLRILCIDLFSETVDPVADARLHKAAIQGYPASYRLAFGEGPDTPGPFYLFIPRKDYGKADAPFMVRNFMSNNQRNLIKDPWTLHLEGSEAVLVAPLSVAPQIIIDDFKTAAGEFIESRMPVGEHIEQGSGWQFSLDQQ